jgi:hypothetical protein
VSKASGLLPAIDNLLLRAQGAYEIERKKRQAGIARWQWVTITVTLCLTLAFLIWLYVFQERTELLRGQLLELDTQAQRVDGKTQELEVLSIELQEETERLALLVTQTEELLRELVARDVIRAQEMQQLRLLLVGSTTEGVVGD